MAGLIAKVAKTPIIIKQETAVEDGKVIFGKQFSALAFVMGMTQADIGLYGTLHNGKVFLVTAMDFEPVLPAIIVCNGKEYDVKAIKPYRNMKSVLLGYRIVAAGG
jgi:hypothetical protein